MNESVARPNIATIDCMVLHVNLHVRLGIHTYVHIAAVSSLPWFPYPALCDMASCRLE